MRPILRTRLKLAAAFAGFAVVVTELDFALHSIVSFYELEHPHNVGFVILLPRPSLAERLVFYLPAVLLALAGFLGGVALYRAIQGRSRWSWYAAALAPVVALLLVYKPPLSHAQLLHVSDAVLPWAAGSWNSWNSTLALGLQAALYLAAAAYLLATVLAVPRGRRRRQIA